jgi:hypothetical protein
MQSSLLELRLRLQQCPHTPGQEPALRVGTSCVAALWDCGCASVGTDFENMTAIPCLVHKGYLTGRSVQPVGLPPPEQIRQQLRAQYIPAFVPERRIKAR